MTLTHLEDSAICKRMQPTAETELSPALSSSPSSSLESNSSNSSSNSNSSNNSNSTIGVALREALWQAMEQGRLKSGVVECAALLEKDPFSVTMCVMPVAGPDDVTAVIQRTLIEAFCHEYHIRLIKVDSVTKLDKILEGRPQPTDSSLTETPPNPTPRATPKHADVICVLVQHGKEEGKEEEEEEGEAGGMAQLQTLMMACGKEKCASAVVSLPDD